MESGGLSQIKEENGMNRGGGGGNNNSTNKIHIQRNVKTKSMVKKKRKI